MSIHIQIIPDRPGLFEESSVSVSTPESELAQSLQSAYQERFLFYERQLAEAMNLLGLLSPMLPPSHYPKISVLIDGEEEEIVFDFGLYETLLEIYIFEGWEGILLVEEALDKRLPLADVDTPSGGTPVNDATIWFPVQAFFRFTRNLLALLIRETLVQIEQKAANAIVTTLSVSNWEVTKAWYHDFQFELDNVYSNVKATPSDHDNLRGGYVGSQKFYRFGKQARGQSDALFATLSKAVRQKFAYEETLQQVARVRDIIRNTRRKIQSPQRRTQPYRKQRLEEQLAHLELRQEELQQVTKQSEEFLKTILSVIHINCPLGLIVLDGLKVGFRQEDMEHKLGMALAEIMMNIDEIGRGVDPGLSRVAAIIPAPIDRKQISWVAVQRWKPPRNGIELCAANAAVGQLASDPGWFPLAHEATWHRLVESGAVVKDSFEYVVYFHYTSALIDLVESKREIEEAFEKFWRSFSRVAAALSLATLATPATAKFAPVLRGASAIADLVVMAYTIYSVTGNLIRFDQLLAEELVHPDAFALEHLARIGELAQIRREALEKIPEQIVRELALTITGARWALVKNLTLARGYYSDLEALLDDGRPSPATFTPADYATTLI